MATSRTDIFKAAILTSVLSVLLMSCRKEEKFGRMSFSTDAEISNTMTKAGDNLTTTTSMHTPGQSFKVYATYRQGSANINVFEKQPVTVTYNTSLGGSSEEYYWRYYTDGRWEYWKPSVDYKFRAVYPGDKVTLESSSSSSQIVVDYKTAVSGAPDNYDLCLAYVERNPTSAGYGPVKLTFKHALSAITIKVRYKDDISLTDKLTSLYMRNLIQAATLLYPSSDGVTTFDWSNNQGINYSDKLYFWSSEAGVPFSNTILAPAFDDEYIFAIPQTIKARQVEVYFETEESGDVVNLGALPAITWQPGMIYDYTLVVSGSGADIEVSIHPWTEYRSENDVAIIY